MHKLPDGQYPDRTRIPTFGRTIGGRGKPDRCPVLEAPDGGTVEDGTVFACFFTVVAADANVGPWGFGDGEVGVEGVEDCEELGVEDFLEADEGLWELVSDLLAS